MYVCEMKLLRVIVLCMLWSVVRTWQVSYKSTWHLPSKRSFVMPVSTLRQQQQALGRSFFAIDATTDPTVVDATTTTTAARSKVHHEDESFRQVATFLLKSSLVGVLTGLSVVIFKTAIAKTSSLFYEDLADILPKPSFYWPLALCKFVWLDHDDYMFIFNFALLCRSLDWLYDRVSSGVVEGQRYSEGNRRYCTNY